MEQRCGKNNKRMEFENVIINAVGYGVILTTLITLIINREKNIERLKDFFNPFFRNFTKDKKDKSQYCD